LGEAENFLSKRYRHNRKPCLTPEDAIIQPNQNSSNDKLLLPVDLIRTAAITLVLLYHVINEPATQTMNGTQYFVYWWSNAVCLSIAVMGVPLFVMLSGSLLLRPEKKHESIRVFLKKRLSRIAVAFVFWSVIYFAWNVYINHVALTPYSILEELLNGGAYKQFWFIYLIMGLYLITPILRVLVAHADRRILRYMAVLWFVGVALVPLLHLITGLQMDVDLFVFGGFLGYFILGNYFMGTRISTKTAKIALAAGFLTTLAGFYIMCFVFNGLSEYYFFTVYTAVGVVFSSAGLYLYLSRYPPDWPKSRYPKIAGLVKAISAYTLPIYFMHVIIIETFNQGLLGVKISLTQIPAPIEIPLLTALSLFICLGIVVVCKKVPVLRTLIG
jgi:surface polysaccharide O-acyltransferase-like enzyme